jgi:cell division septal protein FtsQ
MRVTAPADKRFKRAHLKPARKRNAWRVRHWRVLVGAAILVAGGFAADRAWRTFARLPVFRVTHIVVHGNLRLSNGEVLALLDSFRGESIFGVNLESWRAAVMSSPWVADASLHRTLPSTVDITIQERAPIGIGRIAGALYLIDERGAVIDEYGPHYNDLDLPIIDGLGSGRDTANADASRAMLVRRLMDSLRARSMASRVSQIDVSDDRNAVVLLDGDPTSLRLGNERFGERLQSYLDLIPALHEQVPNIDYVDLRFDERVYVRPLGRHAVETSIAVKPRNAAPPKRSRGTQTG